MVMSKCCLRESKESELKVTSTLSWQHRRHINIPLPPSSFLKKSVSLQQHRPNTSSATTMADTATTTSSDAPENETPTQRQARLRREKRQKKMDEQGEDRLNRIKALNGGVAPPQEVLGGPTAAEGQKASVVDDPDEVDISQNASGFGTPSMQGGGVEGSENPLAAAMLQMQQQEAQKKKQGEGGGEEDPMVRMMQQMMGAMGGNPDDPNAPPPEVPPMVKALLGGGGGADKQDLAPPPTGSAYMWRIVHAVFAFVLATYIALTSTFNGSQLARSQSVYTEESGYGFGRRLSVIFCTAELLLQSMRYFAEKGQLQGSGMIAKVANSGMVPEPYAGYIRIAGRYIGIVQTIIADAMVIVFVFGAMAWWQDKAHA